MAKKAKKEFQYYGDIAVTQKRRLRVNLVSDKENLTEEMKQKLLMKLLNNKEVKDSQIYDITDDEDLKTISVDDCTDLKPTDEAEESEED